MFGFVNKEFRTNTSAGALRCAGFISGYNEDIYNKIITCYFV